MKENFRKKHCSLSQRLQRMYQSAERAEKALKRVSVTCASLGPVFCLETFSVETHAIRARSSPVEVKGLIYMLTAFEP